MTKHDIINKMAAVVAHLKFAKTLCTNDSVNDELDKAISHMRIADSISRQTGVIDEVRKAICIALDVGEECGKTLTRRK
jgi:hypothetical protein